MSDEFKITRYIENESPKANKNLVEVVRCSECKYWRNKDPEQIPTASIMCGHMHPDDYCSYGEREGE